MPLPEGNLVYDYRFDDGGTLVMEKPEDLEDEEAIKAPKQVGNANSCRSAHSTEGTNKQYF